MKDWETSFVSMRSDLSSLRKEEDLFEEYERTQKENVENTGNTISEDIYNLMHYTIYNTFYSGRELDVRYLKEIVLLGQLYTPLTNYDPVDKILSSQPLITYRSFFYPIIQNQTKYTNDCSWGCMIRSGQMLFSQALLRLLEANNTSIFPKQKVISLFVDTPLIKSDLPFFHPFYDKTALKKEVIPPLSIQKLTETNQFNSKGAGVWYSNLDIIRAISYRLVNSECFSDLTVFHSTQGLIEEKEILEECFYPSICTECKKDPILEEYEIVGEPACSGCVKVEDSTFKLKKKGLILISLMLGLGNLNESQAELVLNVLKTRNTVGILGGKKNLGLYFIGVNQNKLVYLDPHLNQHCVTDLSDVDNGTYDTTNLFEVDPSEISASFTVGFMFTSPKEYAELKEDLRNSKLFKFKCT